MMRSKLDAIEDALGAGIQEALRRGAWYSFAHLSARYASQTLLVMKIGTILSEGEFKTLLGATYSP
jgi:hypothetical protein